MSLIRRMRKQKAVWWKRAALPDSYGRYAFLDPVEIDCRWETAGKEYLNEQGVTEVSESVAYVPDASGVNRGDRLRLGYLESDDTNDPTEDPLAYEVRRYEKVPNLRATEFLCIAYLSLRYA